MNKKNLLLFIILAVLIGSAYVYKGPLKEWRANTQKADNFLEKVNIDEVDKIKVTKDGEDTILEKIGENKWKISGTKDFYLKDDLASSMISSLKAMKETDMELVSAKDDKKIEFSTDESGGAKIILLNGDNSLAEFIIGKLASDFTSTYVSEPASSKTYSVKENLSLFARNDWYNKTIFSNDKEKISKIRFQYPDRKFEIEKADGVWKGTSPYKFSVSEEKISEILDIMASLNAVEIPEQNFSGIGLEKNNIIIQATGDGIDNTIIVGDPSTSSTPEGGQAGQVSSEDLYYAIRIGSDNIYLIAKEQRDELNKKISDLK